jgi:hypothetical protein
MQCSTDLRKSLRCGAKKKKSSDLQGGEKMEA